VNDLSPEKAIYNPLLWLYQVDALELRKPLFPALKGQYIPAQGKVLKGRHPGLISNPTT